MNYRAVIEQAVRELRFEGSPTADDLDDLVQSWAAATIGIGDRIQISTALIRQINEESDGIMMAARVVRITTGEDGTKVVYLNRDDAPDSERPGATEGAGVG